MAESAIDFIDSIFEAVWEKLVEIFIYILNLIPSPDFASSAVSSINQVVEYAAYPAYLMGIDAGLPILASAYLIRFTIRRLPFIG